MQNVTFHAAGATSMDSVLAPALSAVWDAMSIGVCVVDAEGVCRYMNPVQRRIDGFKKVEGEHITTLYVPHDLKIIPTLECLQKGQHLLNKVYTYKTTKNVVRQTASDFFALFRNGVRDGVLAFTVWLDPLEIKVERNDSDYDKGSCLAERLNFSYNSLHGNEKSILQKRENF